MAYHVKQEIMTSQQFLIDKGILSMAEQRGIHLIHKWLDEYAKIYAKEILNEILESDCHPEYLPNKIVDAINDMDNPCGI